MTDQSDIADVWATEADIDSRANSGESGQKIGKGSPYSGEGASDDEEPPFEQCEDLPPRPPYVERGILPDGFPIQPLGSVGQKFYFLSARGELVEMGAGAMGHRPSLLAMMSGVKNPITALAAIAAPNGKRDQGFNASALGDKLMEACGTLPLFDRDLPIRNFGTWRAETSHPVVHLGEAIEVGPDEVQLGRHVGRALYPSVPGRSKPADEPATVQEIAFVQQQLDSLWNWNIGNAGAVVVGFVGQAVLGQFPEWRCHMYINGKQGSGKSTLLRIISAMLGGMSSGIFSSATPAGVRQSGNRKALAWIFDEAEKKEDSSTVEEMIAMFRLMSGRDGAQELKGTSDHSGIQFSLYGAGLLGSIIPGHFEAQDAARFVILKIGSHADSDSAADAALRVVDLEEEAERLGPMIWRRMLKLAPTRWDKTFRFYSAMVQELGASSRAGDTIGALLAGWDLMLYDEPFERGGAIDQVRLDQAKTIAQPLVVHAKQADEMGEGERFLRALFGCALQKEHGGTTLASEVLSDLQKQGDAPTHSHNMLLMRLGVRLMGGPSGQRELFVANNGSALLDRLLGNARWKKGGHKAALETLEGVYVPKNGIKITSKTERGVLVPARYLPGYEEPSAKIPEDFA
jgi:hypothetical protein